MRDIEETLARLKIQRGILIRQRTKLVESKIISTAEHDIRGGIAAIEWAIKMIELDNESVKFFRFPPGLVLGKSTD